MTLNIKNLETHKLASDLARRLGVSMTEAVTIALKEKLAETGDAEAARQAKVDRMLAAAKRMRDMIGSEGLPDHAELLYDERGLPKSSS